MLKMVPDGSIILFEITEVILIADHNIKNKITPSFSVTFAGKLKHVI